MNSRSMPCVSVIIPMYKVEKYLTRCLDSVVNQTYKNLDIVIVDDGSPDRCGAIADSYACADSRIRVVHKNNEGISEARNTGIEYACGEWLSFADSDDELAPDAVETMLSLALKEDVPMAMGGYYVCIHKDKHMKKKQVHLNETVLRGSYDLQKYFNTEGKNHNFLWMKIYRKEIFDNIHFLKGKYYEDIFAAKDIIENAGAMAVTDKPVYYYHLRHDSISFGGKMDMHMDGLQARVEWKNYIKGKYPDLEPYSQDALSEYCCYLLGKIKLLGRKKYAGEWEYVLDCFRESYKAAAKESVYLKAVGIMSGISPELLGTACMLYSKIKNG